MENIYHDYWQQELMYQFLVEDKCKKKAYVCSPYYISGYFGKVRGVKYEKRNKENNLTTKRT